MIKYIISFFALLSIVSPAMADDWADLAKYAYQQSQYYSGKAQINHFCEPDKKLCTTYIVVYDPKGMWSLREVENVNEVLVARIICRFNASQDIRTCTNFDTKQTTQEMQGNDQKWIFIN